MFSRILTALAAVVMLALAASPAEARWIKAESPRFIVYSNGSESVLRDYVSKMELFDTFLRARHGLPETGVPLRKLPIYLVRTRDDLQETWYGAGDAIAGYYQPGASNVFAVATSEGRGDDDTILHEYVHHFMLGSFPGAYPSWMVEGYAEYYGVTKITDRFIEVGQVNDNRGESLLAGKWMPMANLLGNKRSSTDWASFYAQSWLLTHYLMSDPERYKQFQAYAGAVAKGADPVKTMTDVTGLSMEALEQTLRRYARSGLKITQFNRGGFAPPQITITTLPPSADDLLLPRVQIVSQYYKNAPPGFLGTIQRRAAKYPGDQLATLTLGQVEAELGDDLKARKLLKDWIAGHPDDAEAMYVLGVALYDDAFEREPEEAKPDPKAKDDKAKDEKAKKEAEEAEAQPKIRKIADKAMMTEAEEWLKKASILAPNDYRILYAYAQARRFSGQYPTAADLDYLIRAYKQAPQVVGLRFELVQVLMAKRHWREARALLSPLVNSPHGGGTAAAAKQLLQRIDEAEKAGG
ncbi:hypothetical protein [Caulobacter sp. NIBR1757]|uniref:hypothetical protein n=1 Tax=Caulobacter sp. NIBR1757 TaxID=3016000 RepID=UPI0022F11A59|nr:hypothetical protein [Caulobacter sp. NIBR1757]WGM40201.1 hypothetical protein AMEJIAPC_03142 [Caulobacter sp. NIBR1757]